MYVYVERCTNSKFSIKTRHVPCPRPEFTCISEVTVEAPGVTIIMARGNLIPVTIDGQMASSTDMILYDVNGVEVKRVGTSIHLFLNTIGIRLSWNGRYDLTVTVSTRLLNELWGIMWYPQWQPK